MEHYVIPERDGMTSVRFGPLYFNAVWIDIEDDEDHGLCIYVFIGGDGKYHGSGKHRMF